MKQITIVLHFEDDAEAQAIYNSLKQIWREEPDQSMSILGSEIVDVKIKGPND